MKLSKDCIDLSLVIMTCNFSHKTREMTIKLVVADGHPLILLALNTIFSAEEDFTVLAECSNGNQVMEALHQHRPDVLVLNKDLQEKDGMAVLRELFEAKNTVQIVLLTTVMDGKELLDAVRCGVRGIVLIDTALKLLVPCVRKVYGGVNGWNGTQSDWLWTIFYSPVLNPIRLLVVCRHMRSILLIWLRTAIPIRRLPGRLTLLKVQ